MLEFVAERRRPSAEKFSDGTQARVRLLVESVARKVPFNGD
jgi:hypothetical protein